MILNRTMQEELFMQKCLMNFIIDIVYEYFKIDPNEDYLKTREVKYINPKQISIYLIKNNAPSITNYEIARQFNFKSHASSIHAYRKIKGYLPYDKKLNTIITMFENKILEYTLENMNGNNPMFVKNEFNEKVEYLKLALELNNVFVTYTECCIIYEIYNRICEVKTQFSITDIVNIKNEILLKTVTNTTQKNI